MRRPFAIAVFLVISVAIVSAAKEADKKKKKKSNKNSAAKVETKATDVASSTPWVALGETGEPIFPAGLPFVCDEFVAAVVIHPRQLPPLAVRPAAQPDPAGGEAAKQSDF